jgi:hypothetical protein
MASQEKPTQEIYALALRKLVADLSTAKRHVKAYKDEVDEMKPEDFDFSEEAEMQPEPEGEKSGEEEGGEMGEEKEKKIKTPEEAKKVLEEAKKDLDDVIQHLDDVCGTAEAGETTASVGRVSATFTSDMRTLRKQAEQVLDDAADALNHWSFLKRKYQPIGSVKNNEIRKAMATVQEVQNASNFFTRLFKKESKQVTSTAVPPTGSRFTGDKWPDGKNPADVELRHWHKGADEFNKDKKFEDARPNAAIEDRLNDVEYQHNDKPFVNATLIIKNPDKPKSARWDVFDSATGKRIVAKFKNVPDAIGPKTENNLAEFKTKAYGNKIMINVMKSGIEATAKLLGAEYQPLTQASLQVIASGDEKGSLRKYYSDAFGDSGYAAKLTSGGDASKEMQGAIDYKPEHDDPNTKTDATKDGPGKMSSQAKKKDDEKDSKKKKKEDEKEKDDKKKEASQEDPQIVAAKAKRAVDAAKVFASRGLISFTVPSIFKKAKELTAMESNAFRQVMASISALPIVDELPLQATAHIPETETGILGNRRQGVSNVNAEVKTEDLNPEIKGDAKIKKNASFIPQSYADNGSRNLKIKTGFPTVEERLKAKGVDTNKFKKANYISGRRTA